MKNKTILIVVVIAVIGVFVFLEGNLTGNIAQRVSYEDLCRSDADCIEGRICCVIYEGYGLCEFEDYCQSIEFLCKTNSDCEQGTVCCISEGMIHGICNYEDRCMSIELFNEYTTKVKAKIESHQLSPQSTKIRAIIIIALIAVIMWLLWRNKQQSKK